MSSPLPEVASLRTNRLLLRPMVIEDADVIAVMQMDPQVMAHYGNGQPLTREQADQTVLKYHTNCRQFDYWAWAVTLASTGEVLGQVTVGWDELDGRRAVALGYILRQSAWGQGYGSEAVAAVVRHGRQHLRWPCVWAGVSPENIPSIRLCEKIGMTLLREELNPRGQPRRVYVMP
jgi:RimJ/RimL family protein N-acetyltransferase